MEFLGDFRFSLAKKKITNKTYKRIDHVKWSKQLIKNDSTGAITMNPHRESNYQR